MLRVWAFWLPKDSAADRNVRTIPRNPFANYMLESAIDRELDDKSILSLRFDGSGLAVGGGAKDVGGRGDSSGAEKHGRDMLPVVTVIGRPEEAFTRDGRQSA